MKIFFLILSMMALMSCGNEANLTLNSKTKMSPVLESEGLKMRIVTPPVGMIGGTAVGLMYEEKHYEIGSQTPQGIKDYLYSLPPGTDIERIVLGRFGKELGAGQNPTAEYDVIHISQIK
jgi:hypothetical protein